MRTTLTTEHLYGGDATVDYLTTLINNIFYTKHVSDIIKKDLLTPVHKKDNDPTMPSNYRGITVISIICKVLELSIRFSIEITLNKHQNKLQKGFTKGVSSINIVLLITEAINEAKDNNENLILIRDRPYNLQGWGVIVFCFAQNFFFGQHES
jgi:hypothetical protein